MEQLLGGFGSGVKWSRPPKLHRERGTGRVSPQGRRVTVPELQEEAST